MKRLILSRLAACLLPFAAAHVFADSILWSGAGSDANWSTAANWTNATAGTTDIAPGPADAASFFDSGSTTPTVDALFGGTIASLRFGSTNNDYATTIPGGVSLNVVGGLRVGTPGDTATAVSRTAGFNGAGTLNLSNAVASLVLNQGTTNGVNGSHAILNLADLDTFNADLNGLAIGSVHYENTVAQRNAGTLYLAKSNLVVLRSSLPLSTYMTLAAATKKITDAGCKLGKVKKPKRAGKKKLVVGDQASPPGLKVQAGAKVNLTLIVKKR